MCYNVYTNKGNIKKLKVKGESKMYFYPYERMAMDLPIYSKCYKCGKTYYRSNRDNGKCPVCLQNERLRKYKKGGK